MHFLENGVQSGESSGDIMSHTLEVILIFYLMLKYIKRRLSYERKIDINYLEKINVKASQCYHYFVL